MYAQISLKLVATSINSNAVAAIYHAMERALRELRICEVMLRRVLAKALPKQFALLHAGLFNKGYFHVHSGGYQEHEGIPICIFIVLRRFDTIHSLQTQVLCLFKSCRPSCSNHRPLAAALVHCNRREAIRGKSSFLY
jgi:hypothetical protein